MIGGKGLTQGAGIIGFHILVGHLFDPLIALLVLGPGPFGQFIDIFLFGVQGHLNLVDDFLKILMKLGMQDGADVF